MQTAIPSVLPPTLMKSEHVHGMLVTSVVTPENMVRCKRRFAASKEPGGLPSALWTMPICFGRGGLETLLSASSSKASRWSGLGR